ncbi:hypothetical protein F5B22DRAFT_636278 [Xylaria bambusicola]|uniref:uncharacterized protein n=1 Tax=Xylaria bambusicola TaxID=326684 RepID=UPI0020073625|nr:uncharacterized protein F5B22DRAFT_636278 [Xylaria bambusicola]KAI0516708.1 hypothetical protein F5B22DRAFT_636278 [Xylaria bambusicola]
MENDMEQRNAPLSASFNLRIASISKHLCQACSTCPEFSSNHKTRKFRLFRPTDALPELYKDPDHIASVDICAHYVAVSYCWPTLQQADDTPRISGSTYQIRELDGPVRKARALDDVLDRAVDVANSCGLRMIWIYQECLPQPGCGSPDSEKHEQLGIQAMDIVYYRAIVTAGLHDIAITNPLQISAISAIAGMYEARLQNAVTAETINYTLDFLKLLLRDRWYTRAWVAQEALSTGPGLMIVLRRDRKRCLTPRYTLDNSSRKMASEVICLPVNQVRDIIGSLKAMLQQNFFFNGQTLRRDEWRPQELLRGAGWVLEAAEQLHPRLARQNSPHGIIQTIGSYNYGTRWTVDAAGALAMLKTRDCRDQEDLIAIVANIYCIDMRLDTRAIRDHGSHREAILALALKNGDLSLLVPDAYGNSSSDFIDPSRNGCWPSPFDRVAMEIDHLTVRNFNLPKLLVPVNFTEAGVSLTSYVWEVDDQLDLYPIKYQYEHIWEEMKCLNLVIDRLEKETPEEFIARRNATGAHFGRQVVLHQAKEDLFLADELPQGSRAWGDIDTAGIRVTQYVSAHRIEELPEMQRIVSEIVFAILRFLYNMGESDSRACGLANSIWQSLRVDVVNGRDDLLDVVSEELLEYLEVIAAPFKTLKLDVDRNGQYSQLWFVDRIMRHGKVWIGRYKKCPSFKPLGGNMRRAESSTDTKGKQPMAKAQHAKEGSSNHERLSTSILRRQLRRTMYANLISSRMPGALQEAPQVTAGTMSTFAEVMTTGIWEAAAEEARVSNLVSAFDVEGPCLVMTPYNADWEMLPRPALRSKSVCWVIELAGSDGEPMDTITNSPDTSGDIAGQPEWASTSKCAEKTRDKKTTDWNKQVYRVTRKVKGLWPLMDPPIIT